MMKKSSAHTNKDFNKIFYIEESKELYGKYFLNFVYLIVILTLTFLAIGFANGSLKYLKKKMDDPFIRWVNVDIPYTLANKIPDLIEDLNTKSLRDSFLYDNINGYNQLSVYFYQKSSNRDIRQATGRTIDIGNPILSSILSAKNLVKGISWKDEYDIGLIITEKLLKDLGYTKEIPSFLIMSYALLDNRYIKAPLPVIALVNDLPGNNLFACTPYFYVKRNSEYFPFNVSSENYQQELIYFIEGDHKKASDLTKKIYDFLKSDELYSYFNDTLIQVNYDPINKGYNLIFTFSSDLVDPQLVPSFDEKVKKNNELKKSELLRVYNYDLSGFENESHPFDNLSIYFTSLDRIRDFSAFLLKTIKLKIDMSQIESKENYNFVSKLTYFISGFLVIFSVISIILFLTNILKVHINKVKPNLGTFKAFGLSNSLIVRIYSLLTLSFLLLAIIVSLALSFGVGETGFFRWLFRLAGSITDKDFRYFSLLTDGKTYIALSAIILINSVVLPVTIWRMLNKTPGDLIYNRETRVKRIRWHLFNYHHSPL